MIPQLSRLPQADKDQREALLCFLLSMYPDPPPYLSGRTIPSLQPLLERVTAWEGNRVTLSFDEMSELTNGIVEEIA